MNPNSNASPLVAVPSSGAAASVNHNDTPLLDLSTIERELESHEKAAAVLREQKEHALQVEQEKEQERICQLVNDLPAMFKVDSLPAVVKLIADRGHRIPVSTSVQPRHKGDWLTEEEKEQVFAAFDASKNDLRKAKRHIRAHFRLSEASYYRYLHLWLKKSGSRRGKGRVLAAA